MPQPLKFIGIEIGGTKLQIAIGNNRIDECIRKNIDPSAGAGKIQEQIIKGIEELMQQHPVAGIGVGFGGPVDHHTGIIQLSHQVRGWEQFPFKEWLQARFDKPVVIDNDANVAALGEAQLGAGMGFQRVFYMTIGSGIGGGFVINGNIYHGRLPGEMEIGHTRLNKGGATLESRCSGWAVNQQVKDFMITHPESFLARSANGNTGAEARLLQPALEKGDTAAGRIRDAVADDLAFGLSHLVHLLNPDVIVIGGGLSLLQDHLLQPVAERLPQYLMPALLPAPPIRAAALGEGVVPAGALALAAGILHRVPTNLNLRPSE